MFIRIILLCVYLASVQAAVYSIMPRQDYSHEFVMSKRSAAVLSKILLQSLRGQWDADAMRRMDGRFLELLNPDEKVNLERREPKQLENPRKYMRCYFNAVSCF